MKKLYLSNTDKKIFGVCGGMAEYFQIDSSLIRVIVIFIGLITAVIPAVLTYIIAALVIPMKGHPVVHDVSEEKKEKATN